MDDSIILADAEDLMYNGQAFLAENPVGDVDAGLANAVSTIDSTYYLPYVSHVCMEVLNCTVDYRGDSCEIWCPVQAASWVHGEAVALTGLPSTAVVVHTTFLGGGLGRKIERDYFSQAIQVAMGMKVKAPVKFTWLREEDTRFEPPVPDRLVVGMDAEDEAAQSSSHHS